MFLGNLVDEGCGSYFALYCKVGGDELLILITGTIDLEAHDVRCQWSQPSWF